MIDVNVVSFHTTENVNWNITFVVKLMGCGSIIIQLWLWIDGLCEWQWHFPCRWLFSSLANCTHRHRLIRKFRWSCSHSEFQISGLSLMTVSFGNLARAFNFSVVENFQRKQMNMTGKNRYARPLSNDIFENVLVMVLVGNLYSVRLTQVVW